MSKIYFISDMHFNHANIIEYCRRPFKNVEEMNKVIIENWNKTVTKHDTVFVLGDLALQCSKEQVAELIEKLKGRKILIMGNHDKWNMDFYYSIGFKEVYKYPILYKKFFLISHEPVKFVDQTPYLNIHGHTHNNMMIVDDHYFNVSVEQINYTPILFEEIKNKRGFD